MYLLIAFALTYKTLKLTFFFFFFIFGVSGRADNFFAFVSYIVTQDACDE